MELRGCRDQETAEDVLEVLDYPSEYILVHALHLALDRGYKVRIYNTEEGRLLVHGSSWIIFIMNAWLDVRVGHQAEDRVLRISARTDHTGKDEWHKDVALKFWKDLDFRLMNQYTARIARERSDGEVKVHDMWNPVLEGPFPERLEEPNPSRAIGLLGLTEGLTLSMIIFLWAILDIADYFVHWYGILIFAFPPVLAMGLLLLGWTSVARTAFDWGQAGGIFVLAILTLGIGYFLLFIPSIQASFAISEVDRWRHLYYEQERFGPRSGPWSDPHVN